MMLRRRGFGLVSLLVLASCSSKSEPDAGGLISPPSLEDVVYVGGTTDEALERMLDVRVADEPGQYVVVDAPDLDAPLAADSPASFEWHLASEATLHPARRGKPAPAPSPAWQRPLRELLQLLGPPRVAHAHGTPYNGVAYLLELGDADGEVQLRVFSGNASYTPSAAVWQRLAEAKQPLTLEITSAFFEDNAVATDGGPYRGGSFDFSIE